MKSIIRLSFKIAFLKHVTHVVTPVGFSLFKKFLGVHSIEASGKRVASLEILLQNVSALLLHTVPLARVNVTLWLRDYPPGFVLAIIITLPSRK